MTHFSLECYHIYCLHDKPDNQNFENKLEKVQHKACLAITGAIQGTSRQILYQSYMEVHPQNSYLLLRSVSVGKLNLSYLDQNAL